MLSPLTLYSRSTLLTPQFNKTKGSQFCSLSSPINFTSTTTAKLKFFYCLFPKKISQLSKNLKVGYLMFQILPSVIFNYICHGTGYFFFSTGRYARGRAWFGRHIRIIGIDILQRLPQDRKLGKKTFTIRFLSLNGQGLTFDIISTKLIFAATQTKSAISRKKNLINFFLPLLTTMANTPSILEV